MDTLYNLPGSITQRSYRHSDGKRPASFEPGREYLWFYSNISPATPTQKPVKFVRYDACPAFVIVLDPTGKTVRCPRDELFLL